MTSDPLNERMLNAWLRLSTALSNERLVQNMPYNEALICNILDQASEKEPLTATDLCEKTKILKSQMNRTLKDMEKRGLIFRERSSSDKRKIYITLNPEHRRVFLDEHHRNLQLVDTLLDRYGREKAETLVKELNAFTNIIEEVLS